MRRHLAYAIYVARHKWFVFLACIGMRVPMHQAIIHDWSKFTPLEWFTYARNFYNSDGTKRSGEESAEFKRAWLRHQRLRHHWQSWVLINDDGPVEAVEMPDRFVREMIADWIGAGRAIAGRRDPRPWYAANKDRMTLHPNTRVRVEALLGDLP